MNRRIVVIGMVLVVLSIILGAFGAHALKEHLPVEKLVSYETGVRYQMYHGLAFMLLGFNWARLNSKWGSNLILIGVIMFSGSIFLLALQPLMGIELKFLGPVTPVGGVLMITGWVITIFRLLNDRQISD